jgi:RimJ/RimL family protein N-acetyltransferase
MTAPILVTARLTLRPHRREDFADLCTLWGDPDVTRFIGGRPQTPEENWARLTRYGGMWALDGYGFWAVTLTGHDTLIGDAGVMLTRRTIAPPLTAPETGWAFSPRVHGQGVATEAMGAVLAWADAHVSPVTECIIAPGHAASARVAEKLGYCRVDQRPYHGDPIDVWRRG